MDKKIRKKSPNPSNGYLCVCIEGGGVVILHNIYLIHYGRARGWSVSVTVRVSLNYAYCY